MTNRFSVECFSSIDDKELTTAWTSLEKTGTCTAFQTLDYISAVHDSFLKEGEDQARYILLRERDSHRPVMIVPMVVRQRLGVRILETMDYDVVDYCDPICCLEVFDDQAASRHAGEHIRSIASDCDVLVLKNWTIGSPGFSGVMPQSKTKPQTSCTTFNVPLADGAFEQYRKSNGAFKQAMKKMRRMKKEFEAEVRFITGDDEIDAAFDAMIEHRRIRFKQTGKTDGMADPRRQRLFRALAHQKCSEKEALLLGISIGSNCIATSFGVAHNGVMHAQLSSFSDGPWSRHSPGMVTMALEMEWAHGNGLRRYDLGPGEADYKERFGVEQRHRMILEEPVTNVGALYLTAQQTKAAAKQIIKQKSMNLFRGRRSATLPYVS